MTQKNSNIHLLVCLYGIYESSFRSEIEISGIQKYTQDLLSKIENTPEILSNIKTLTLCGGYTQPEYSSESETNLSLYSNFLKKYPKINLIHETISQDSMENIVFGYLAIRKYKPKNIIIVCDSARGLKMEILSKFLLSEAIASGVKVDFLVVDRPDTHPSSTTEYQSKIALPELLSSPKIQILKQLINIEKTL